VLSSEVVNLIFDCDFLIVEDTEMGKIQIADLQQVQTEFDELSDLELGAILGGKERYIEMGFNKDGPFFKISFKCSGDECKPIIR
jgi:hypothetical protein